MNSGVNGSLFARLSLTMGVRPCRLGCPPLQDRKAATECLRGWPRAIAGGRRVKALRWWHLYSRPGGTARGGDFHPKLLHIGDRAWASWCTPEGTGEVVGAITCQPSREVSHFDRRSSEMGGGSCELLSNRYGRRASWADMNTAKPVCFCKTIFTVAAAVPAFQVVDIYE